MAIEITRKNRIKDQTKIAIRKGPNSCFVISMVCISFFGDVPLYFYVEFQVIFVYNI